MSNVALFFVSEDSGHFRRTFKEESTDISGFVERHIKTNHTTENAN